MVVDEGSVATVGDRDPAIDGDAGLIELLAPLEYAYDLSVYARLGPDVNGGASGHSGLY